MSNDKFGTLFKQMATVSKLVVDGKRDASQVSGLMQGIIDSPSFSAKGHNITADQESLDVGEGVYEVLRTWLSRLMLPIGVLGLSDETVERLIGRNIPYVGSLLFYDQIRYINLKLERPLVLTLHHLLPERDRDKSIREFQIVLRRLEVDVLDDSTMFLMGTTPNLCYLLFSLFEIFSCTQTKEGVHGLSNIVTDNHRTGLATDFHRSDSQYHGFVPGES